MVLTVHDRNEAARLLADALKERRPIAPLAKRFTTMTIDDAYGIQLVNVAVRLVAGDAVTGHKVGLTNAAIQALFGADHPAYGHLFEDMVMNGGGSVSRA